MKIDELIEQLRKFKVSVSHKHPAYPAACAAADALQDLLDKRSVLPPFEIVRRYGQMILTYVAQKDADLSFKHRTGIDAILESIGLDFDWDHSSQPFEEFVNELEYRDSVKRALMARWKQIKDSEEECEAVLAAVRQCLPQIERDPNEEL